MKRWQNAMPNAHYILHVAYSGEARALIDLFGLKKRHDIRAFEIYANTKAGLHLIVSGQGVINAANAVGFMAGHLPSDAPKVFVNLGVAGAYQVSVGSIFLVDKIVYCEEKPFYPMGLGAFSLPKKSLVTVDKPVVPTEMLPMVDMEAYGFFQAAAKYATAECIHSLKIVSDNETESFASEKVCEWFMSQEEAISDFLETLNGLSEKLSTHQHETVTPDLYFTQYQQKQFDELVRQWFTSGESSESLSALVQDAKSATQYLAKMRDFLAAKVMVL